MKYWLPFVFFVAPVVSQANWSLQSASGLGQRESHSLVYDPTTQRTFAMWGTTYAPTFNCSMWNGSTWTPSSLSVGGGLLFIGRDVSLASNGAGGMLMFGGWRSGFGMGGGTPSVVDQTWSVVATASGSLQFTLLAPATRPAARQGASMVLTNQGPLLFGGALVSGYPVYGDTWRWNGTTWLQLTTPVAPAPTAFGAMAYDGARNVVVLLGGFTSNETWEFDGVAWQQRFPAQSPLPRLRAAFAWSPLAGKCVLFGGAGTSTDFGDTWTWDGTSWQQLLAIGAPSARRGAAMTFDAAHQKLVLCGGGLHTPQSTTWYEDTYHVDLLAGQATYTPFGAGCPGPTAQVPTFAAAPNELPVLGTTSHLVVSNLPAALTLPVFVLGTSNTWEPSSNHPLPFDLGFVGWPGCQQLVSHDVLTAVPTFTGTASLAFAVPLNAALVGLPFHAQALVLYVPSGAAVSNAMTGVVGF
jgi:hypothetical protein